jgi:hypothetical protein
LEDSSIQSEKSLFAVSSEAVRLAVIEAHNNQSRSANQINLTHRKSSWQKGEINNKKHQEKEKKALSEMCEAPRRKIELTLVCF